MSDTPDGPPVDTRPTPAPTDSPPAAHDGTPVVAQGGPHLGMAEAVKATGMSRTTMQRRLKDGDVPGAHRGLDGNWSIPIRGLIEAGMMPRTTPPDAPAPRTTVVGRPTATPLDPTEMDRLRAEVDRLRAERDLARMLADERAAALADLRKALDTLSRALPAAPDPTDPTDEPGTPVTAPAAATPTRRPRWWTRGN